MFERFYPYKYYESAYDIPYEELYKEGFKGIIFDVDNTLVAHGAPADDKSLELFKRLKEIGYECTLLSNNKAYRVEAFNKDIGAYMISRAGKPQTAGYLKACEMMGTDVSNTFFVGDQIFTDIWGANRAGIKSLMVKYIDPKEEIQIVLKRCLEKIVLREYFMKYGTM